LLLDFDYDEEPLPGTYPVAGLGPLRLLQESRVNHLGKLGFRWVYWNLLLAGRDVPLIHGQMTMRGKHGAPPPLAPPTAATPNEQMAPPA
jgi:sulfide:quinone oxidoreductase